MTVEQAIAILQQEDPKSELFILVGSECYTSYRVEGFSQALDDVIILNVDLIQDNQYGIDNKFNKPTP